MSRLQELRNKYPESSVHIAEADSGNGLSINSAAHVGSRFGYDAVINNPDLGIFGVFDGSAANPVANHKLNEGIVRVMEEEEPVTNLMEAKRQMKEQLAVNTTANFLLARVVTINDSVYAIIGSRGNSHAYSYTGGDNVRPIAGKTVETQPNSGYFSGITAHELTPGERLILASNGGLSSVRMKDVRGTSLVGRTLGARSTGEALKNIVGLDSSANDKAYVVIDIDYAQRRKRPGTHQPVGAVALTNQVEKPKEELKLPPAPGKPKPEKPVAPPASPYRQLFNVMSGLPTDYTEEYERYITQTERLTRARPLAAVGFTWMENEGNRWFRVKGFHSKGPMAGHFEIVEIVTTSAGKKGQVKFIEIPPRRDTEPYDDKDGGLHYGMLVQQYQSIPEFMNMLQRKNKLEDMAKNNPSK